MVLSPVSAYAEVDLVGGLGGVADYGTSCLHFNDDGSSSVIDITSAFPSGVRFFSQTHSLMYVNTNGNITFSGPLSTFTPNPFPVASRPMIAPFWADVDTRGESCRTTSNCSHPLLNGIWWSLRPGEIIVTWNRVGYFSCHDDLKMDFQLVIRKPEGVCIQEGDFDVEFRYHSCEWETGDASGGTAGFGGTPAQAGFDAGDTINFVEIMGSRTGGIANRLCDESNVGEPGLWKFKVRAGSIQCAGAGEDCETGLQGVCARGKTQCVGREIVCQQTSLSSPLDGCDALDNDCDGKTDEGTAICEGQLVCSEGRCVEPCFEIGCGPGFFCSAGGACIEDSCKDVVCETGVCERGRCRLPCEGIVCPQGEVCESGRCIDPCEGKVCDGCSICEGGSCIPRCANRVCGIGEVCGQDGHCIDAGCVNMTCDQGFYCADGVCQDKCIGVSCPFGESCRQGLCQPTPPMPPEQPKHDGGFCFPGDPYCVPDGGLGGQKGEPSKCNCSLTAESRRPSVMMICGSLLLAFVWLKRR